MIAVVDPHVVYTNPVPHVQSRPAYFPGLIKLPSGGRRGGITGDPDSQGLAVLDGCIPVESKGHMGSEVLEREAALSGCRHRN